MNEERAIVFLDGTMLRRGAYCEVLVNDAFDMVTGTTRQEWKQGIVVSVGPKRVTVDIGRRHVTKRKQFVRPI